MADLCPYFYAEVARPRWVRALKGLAYIKDARAERRRQTMSVIATLIGIASIALAAYLGYKLLKAGDDR